MKTPLLILLVAVACIGLQSPLAAQPTNGGPTEHSTPPDAPPDLTNTPPPDAMPDQNPADKGAAPEPETAPPPPNEAVPKENQPVVSTVILPKANAPVVVPTAFTPPAQAHGTNVNDLNLNFNHAPLDMVLGYLSDAAGFIIVQNTRVNGTVTVMGQHLTQDEAVSLLNNELNRNNYAAIRDGRTLTIVDKNDAKTRNIPVKMGNNPTLIPNNTEIATWIIPIRYVEARQLVSDLSTFVSPQATIVANEAGNSIVVTDTQANIRHLAEIIQAVDGSAEAETEIRVFTLKYASPTDVANELASVFPSGSSGSGTQSPISFRGGGGRSEFFSRMMGGAAGGANSGSNDRIKKATQVTAVADARIQAVIVTAPKQLMSQIADMMTSLDVPSDRDQNVSVISLENGDPQQVVQVLQNMFQSSTTSRSGNNSSSSQNSALQQRAQNSITTMGTTTTTSGGGGTSSAGGGRSIGGGGR